MDASKQTAGSKTITTTTTKNAFVPRSAVTVKMTSSSNTVRSIGKNSSRSSAPLVSSAKQNREKEKKELQDLNQRFAKYIEKVRFLEAQNKKLVKELETLRGSWGKETREIKARYQTELAESRAEVDDTLREKAQLEIRVQSVLEEKADIQNDFASLKKDFEKLTKALQEEHNLLAEYESEVGLMRRRVGFLDEENIRLKKKTTEQADEISKLRALVDSEQLGRVHAENKVRSLEEELEFLKSVHDQEMKELGALAYRDTTAENREFWKSELAVAIRDLQAEYETKVDMIKSELETNYMSKISQIQSGNVRSTLEVEQSKEETKKSRDRLQALRNQLLDLERQVAHWKSMYQDKMTEFEESERNWDMQITQLQTNYTELENELEMVRAELEEILDAKLSMELEIAAYRRLLEGDQSSLRRCVDDWMQVGKGEAQSEESIFGKIIHQVKDFVHPEDKHASESSSKFTSQRMASEMSIKTTVHKTSSGNLTVDETSPDNSYAVVKNKGEKAEKMDGMVLRRTVDGKEDVHFKFKNLTLNPGKTVRIVTKTFKGKTNADYVFEGEAAGMGKNVVLSLFNDKGEEQASLVMKNVYG